MKSTLDGFFQPRGIVAIGVSSTPGKLGYGLARNITNSGFPGKIYFIGRNAGTLFGREIYKDIASLPGGVELAILLLPAEFIPEYLNQCAQKGIKNIIISSGGFAETGKEGKRLEEECLRIARENSLHIIGPNCIGIIDSFYPLNTTFLPTAMPEKGCVTFVSHSGAICAAVLDWSKENDFGISKMVSLGNQIDINESSLLEFIANDKNSDVVAMYIEGVSNGRDFIEKAKKAVFNKPVIALKVGRYESGQKAIASHTGALAGKDTAIDAAFRRAGVTRADTIEELFEVSRALEKCPLPEGPRVAVLTNAGGPGVAAADAIEGSGLELASLSEQSVKAMKEFIPSAASLLNPIDLLAMASPDQYARCLQILLDDTNIDGVVVIMPPPPMHAAAAVVMAIIPIIQETVKPVIVSLMGGPLVKEARERLEIAGIPEYGFPEKAVKALAVLWERKLALRRLKETPLKAKNIDKHAIGDYLKEKIATRSGFLNEEECRVILSSYGIPVLEQGLVKSATQAVEIANRIGYPVVMKIDSEDIPHKSDVGGVLLGIKNNDEVQKGYQLMIENIKSKMPKAKINGVNVQKMVNGGQEVILGTYQDQQFGAMIMFGSGGVEVEGLNDIEFAIAPITGSDIDYLIKNTWAGRKLDGFRNIPAVDRLAVEDVMVKLASLAYDFPELEEIEINPLIVLEKGQGAVAIDIRVKKSITA